MLALALSLRPHLLQVRVGLCRAGARQEQHQGGALGKLCCNSGALDVTVWEPSKASVLQRNMPAPSH
eukprot:6678576-Lingulodinium_polyedra.AAC.1